MSYKTIFNNSGYLRERFYRNLPGSQHGAASRDEVLGVIDEFKNAVLKDRGALGSGHEMYDKDLRSGLSLCQRYIDGRLQLTRDEAAIVFDGTWQNFKALEEIAEELDAGK